MLSETQPKAHQTPRQFMSFSKTVRFAFQNGAFCKVVSQATVSSRYTTLTVGYVLLHLYILYFRIRDCQRHCHFRFLVSRGEACGKKIQTEQKRIDGRFFIIHLKSVCHPKYFCIFVANKL